MAAAGPMLYASSALFTCTDRVSSSENTATDFIPSSLHARYYPESDLASICNQNFAYCLGRNIFTSINLCFHVFSMDVSPS